MTTYIPRELAAELGHTNESLPGQVDRVHLREKYAEHSKHERWKLDEAQADDVRANLPRTWRNGEGSLATSALSIRTAN